MESIQPTSPHVPSFWRRTGAPRIGVFTLLVIMTGCGGGKSGANDTGAEASAASATDGTSSTPTGSTGTAAGGDSGSSTSTSSDGVASTGIGTSGGGTSGGAQSGTGPSGSGASGSGPSGTGTATTTAGVASSAGGASTTLTSDGTTTSDGAGTTGSASGTGGASSTGGSTGTDAGSSTSGGGTSACGETSGVEATKIYYVTPSGSPTADGSSFASAMDFESALAALGPGEIVLLEPGTYTMSYQQDVANTIELSRSGTSGAPLGIVAANCGRAVIDFAFPEQGWVQDSYGFYVTGSYWYFKGIDVTRAGYQGVYVTGQHNTFENCAFYRNRNTGLEINKGGAYTTVINCDSYRNYDPKKLGSMADGFGPKQTQGPGNHFIGCRAWENSDDGFDAFDSPETVIIENSWAFRNGVDVWGYGGFSGNGNGFKLGGNEVAANNRITNSVAFGNVAKGFDQNNNAGGLTILNCLGYDNGTNFGLGNPVNSGEQHFLRNNVSLGASESIANADAAFNSWDSGPSASNADFLSLDVSLATEGRNPDGSLPDVDLFRLAPNSQLINAGVDVGLPYSGSAPDLGAFEHEE